MKSTEAPGIEPVCFYIHVLLCFIAVHDTGQNIEDVCFIQCSYKSIKTYHIHYQAFYLPQKIHAYRRKTLLNDIGKLTHLEKSV